MSDIVHVRRTIVVEYDVDRADYDDYDDWTDAKVVAYETEAHNTRNGWSLHDFDDDQITSSTSEVTFR